MGVLLTRDDWHDGSLLDGRWALETVGVDTTEELGLQVHGIEGVGGLIVVGLDLSWESAVSIGSKDCCCARTDDVGATQITYQDSLVLSLISSKPLASAMIAVLSFCGELRKSWARVKTVVIAWIPPLECSFLVLERDSD